MEYTLLNICSAATATISMGRLSSWQTTQEWSDGDCWARWPPQWWWIHSAQVEAADRSDWWICSDENTSIGTNTANSTQEQICLFVFVFTASSIACIVPNTRKSGAKLQKIREQYKINRIYFYCRSVVTSRCKRKVAKKREKLKKEKPKILAFLRKRRNFAPLNKEHY